MSKKQELMPVYVDLLPNQPKNAEVRELFGRQLTEAFEKRLPAAVERIWELPPLMVKEPLGEYVSLLREARDLFVDGRFYACVAMCGIVGERLVKDALRASVLVKKKTVQGCGRRMRRLISSSESR